MEIPEILYKYRNWNKESHMKLILEQEIFFASPKSFNDPFDCKIPLRYDLLTKEDWDNKLLFHIKDQHPNWTKEEINKEFKYWQKESYSLNDETYVREHMNDELNQIENTYGIFSLSSVNNNILMWSHYSDCHTGFCVGFNTNKLIEKINSYSNNNLFFELHRVNYQYQYPIIIPKGFESDKWYIERLKYKSKFWEYENEYRILSYFTGANCIYTIDKECIKELIIGLNMSDIEKMKFINTVTHIYNDIKIYECKRSENNFEIQLINVY